jgi:C-terminal processing protease CtpA/Prc
MKIKLLRSFVHRFPLLALSITAALLLSVPAIPVKSQSLKTIRDRGKEMLGAAKEDIEKYYYDPKFHGMNLDERFKTAREKINTASSNSQIFSIIAQAVVDLNDSHTFFLPPDRYARFDYGWRMQMFGDIPIVVAVKGGSEAESKGLKVGDVVYSIDGYQPTRKNLWKIEYSYYVLKPRATVRLVLQNADGSLRELEIKTRVLETDWRTLFGQKGVSAAEAIQYYELRENTLICRMPSFVLAEKDIDNMMKRIQDYKAVILDLRGNSGGYEKALLRLIGHMFDHDIKLGELIRRDKPKALVAKSVGRNVFKGEFVVLVDSRSASAAELFARVLQLEKRATVMGDRTRGAVMRARRYGHSYERGPFSMMWLSSYGMSVTDADIVMADGKSLERVGVTPDELIIPKASDFTSFRDPVLSRAAARVGVKLDPKKAGALYPTDRRTEINLEEEPDEQP